jgi:sugar O-acyltransferase (sialic acid O-acetyltransferase NeuD family)
MVFYGASGHGKVIIEAHTASGEKVTGILDDNTAIKALLSYPVSGKYEQGKFPGALYCVSIGNNCIRKKIANSISEKFGRVTHPDAVTAPSCVIGQGTVVMAGVIINAESRIGDHVILNTGSVVDHDCVIEDFVHVSPNATICGGVHIGEGTHIGAGATVIQNIRVGKWATIGAGAVIIEDVPDYSVVVGVPGVIKKFNKENS